jgi:hypothetical protein
VKVLVFVQVTQSAPHPVVSVGVAERLAPGKTVTDGRAKVVVQPPKVVPLKETVYVPGVV